MSVDDRTLLRRFEPILRYTQGEEFYPMNIVPYLQESSLWVTYPGKPPHCLLPEQTLTPTTLGALPLENESAFCFLKFIEPLNIAELAAYTVQQEINGYKTQRRFRESAGRLARVGYVSRFVDGLFSLSLLARGRVPGDTSAAAVRAYQQIQTQWPTCHYYARVLRQNQWIVLQYWFFYAFNNWRSGFSGVNDHEADWETICIYLEEPAPDVIAPVWVASSTHDACGDDLRRRWDDPELRKVGEHPILYTAAGSHAGYFSPGEYLTEVELPFLAPVVRLFERLPPDSRRLLQWQDDHPSVTNGKHPPLDVMHIPFIDYARGDGLAVGPQQEIPWDEPELIHPAPEWVENYRGLWGLYANDPASGENAPSGPRYNRDGTIRQSWYDPLGWVGLDKVPPPYLTAQRIAERQLQLAERQAELNAEIADQSARVTGLGVELAALQGITGLAAQENHCRLQLNAAAAELDRQLSELASNEIRRQALKRYTERLNTGYAEPPRAHLHRERLPISETDLRLSRFAELWAAVSTNVIMVSFVLLIFFAPHYIFLGLVLLTAVVLLVEAGARQRLTQFVDNITVMLAIIAAVILIYDFFWQLLVIGILAAGGYLMWENTRELLR